MSDKSELSWRSGAPVLDYVLRGFWSLADGNEWIAKITDAVAQRPAGQWYMCGDLTELKAQTQEVNDLRNAVTELTLAAGLIGCVMVSPAAPSKMQLKRLLDASPNPDAYRYVTTHEEAEVELNTLMARP